MRTPSHFYVYYRVGADTALARTTIGALMADVEARTGICGRLLSRCDDPSTWMEVYEPVADAAAFARTLAACVRTSRAADVAVDRVRTVERFAGVAPQPGRRAARRRP